MLTPAGKTYLRGVLSSVRLQPARLTFWPPVLCNSIQSGYVPPFATAETFSAITSFKTTEVGGGGLEYQFAGSSGSANGSTTFSDAPPPSAAVSQPF